VLGGTQSLHTNSYDEALALPTEDAARIALRTQQIIAFESGAADTVDPLAGSYFIENLTNRVEEQTMDYIDRIDKMGHGSILEGVLRGIDDGFFQREIAQAAYLYQQQVERGDQIIVGVNKYAMRDGMKPNTLRIDPDVERRQLKRLKKTKNERDNAKAQACLDALREAIEAKQNSMPYIVEAVKAYASVGEIMSVCREVYGAYREPAMI
jgi:methylmalonyl-CoA mutase N-terminal domain/subunit